MGTTILRPRDLNSFPNHNHPLNSPPFNQYNRRSVNKSNRQKKTPVTGLKNTACSRSLVDKVSARNLVMEKVTILKRGEELKVEVDVEDRREDVDVKNRRCRDPRNKRTVRFEEKADRVLCSTDRLGPEPEMLLKQIRVDKSKGVDCCLYAGQGAIVSPPPSSVPVPVFFAKKKIATDLRRLLRLDDLI